jgi:hypothetical protein
LELFKNLTAQTVNLDMFANLETAQHMTAPLVTIAHQEVTMASTTKRCSSVLVEPTMLSSVEFTDTSAKTALQATSVTKKGRQTTLPMLVPQATSVSKVQLSLKLAHPAPMLKKTKAWRKVTAYLALTDITAPKELRLPSNVLQATTAQETQCYKSHAEEVTTVTKTLSIRKRSAQSISIVQEGHLKLQFPVTTNILADGEQKCNNFAQLVSMSKICHDTEVKTNANHVLLDSTQQCRLKVAKNALQVMCAMAKPTQLLPPFLRSTMENFALRVTSAPLERRPPCLAQEDTTTSTKD